MNTTQLQTKYELFVFDWDGTIMDTSMLIARGVQEAAKALGYDEPDIAEIKSAIGLSWGEIIERVCPQCPVERYEAFGQAYRDWYIRREEDVPVVEGLEALMRSMVQAGCRLAVATGKSRKGLDRVFALTGLGDIFEETITADESFSKPNPAMLLELMDRTGVAPDKMVMIGDSIHDLMLAQNAGCDALGVTFGACTKEELDKYPNIGIATDTRELARILGVDSLLSA